MQSLKTNTLDPQIHTLIQENVSLHDKNWFGTGGTTRYFIEPTSSIELQQALLFARMNDLPIFTLGSGANILISDDGFSGLVIRQRLKELEIKEHDSESLLVKAGAGVDFDDLIQFCLKNQLLGLEEFSGIPGTVGGSVYINIHYFQYLLSDFLIKAEVVDKKTGEILMVGPEWFNFGYDQSRLQEKQHYLASATFKLKKASALEIAHARGRYEEIIRHRHNRYPLKGTCGSFFRNFHDNEVTMKTTAGKKLIFVAYYLDTLGIKGSLSVGNAKVSHQHANMIVNQGNATSTDIINLARLMQEKVYEKYGIISQPECQLIGFKDYPLLS